MEIITAKQKLREGAQEIVDNHFSDWYRAELGEKNKDIYDSLSVDEVLKLSSLKALAANKLDNLCAVTDGDFADEIAISAAKVVADFDERDNLLALLMCAYKTYYKESITELLTSLYDERKDEEGLTLSTYEQGMKDYGHSESDFS